MRTAFLSVLLGLSVARAQTEDLAALKAKSETAQTRIRADCAQQKAQALRTYEQWLDTALRSAKQKGDLDGYLAIEQEFKRFKAEKTVPEPDTAQAQVAAAVTAYRATVKKADEDRDGKLRALVEKYVARLDAFTKQLVTQGKIEEAKKAKAEQNRMEFVLADLKPAEAPPPPPDKPDAAPRDAGAASALPAELRAGLVLHYGFEKEEGGQIADLSGSDNPLQLGVARGCLALGKSGNGFRSDQVEVTSSKNVGIGGTQPRSFLAWVKVARDAPRDLSLAGWGGVHGPNAYDYCRYFRLNIMGGCWGLWRSGPDWRTPKQTEPNEWAHLAVTYDGSIYHWYVDTQDIASGTGGYSQTGDSPFVIPVHGKKVLLDELMVWNRTLTADEVKRIYLLQGGKPVLKKLAKPGR